MVDIERIKKAKKQKDGWWASLFSGPSANLLLPLIADVKWITPNCVTSSSLAICLIACSFISIGSHLFLIIGALLLQLVFIVDCLDGQLARYRNACSNFGAWYDRVTDRLKDFLIYFSLAFGYFKITNDWTIWPFAMTSFFFVFLFDYYVNMDIKLEPIKKASESIEIKKKSFIFNLIGCFFSIGEKIYKGIPILQFHIGEQYLILTLFLLFNKVKLLFYFVTFLGVFYSLYWPLSKYYGRKPS